MIFGKLSLRGGDGKFLVYRGGRSFRRDSRFPTFQRGDQDFETFKKGGGPEKRFWGWGNQMREKNFKDKEGAIQLFKLNLGIVKKKLRTFRDKLA